ncbi:hypothetical protein IWX90DRAFT_231752 [Phyllosticta citrichinensis]|uniref:Uncharacterized protein n=1 Tax=Phyllosticta citrichinensis TaxID=1130410 RepID=A0ABR1XUU4_9PEZI
MKLFTITTRPTRPKKVRAAPRLPPLSCSWVVVVWWRRRREPTRIMVGSFLTFATRFLRRGRRNGSEWCKNDFSVTSRTDVGQRKAAGDESWMAATTTTTTTTQRVNNKTALSLEFAKLGEPNKRNAARWVVVVRMSDGPDDPWRVHHQNTTRSDQTSLDLSDRADSPPALGRRIASNNTPAQKQQIVISVMALLWPDTFVGWRCCSSTAGAAFCRSRRTVSRNQ